MTFETVGEYCTLVSAVPKTSNFDGTCNATITWFEDVSEGEWTIVLMQNLSMDYVVVLVLGEMSRKLGLHVESPAMSSQCHSQTSNFEDSATIIWFCNATKTWVGSCFDTSTIDIRGACRGRHRCMSFRAFLLLVVDIARKEKKNWICF